VDLRLVAPLVAAFTLATPAQFLRAHQLFDGGFADAGGKASPALTAWAALGLVSAGDPAEEALGYLKAHDGEPMTPATLALVALAEAALGDGRLAAALPADPGGQTNAVIWTIIARRQAGRTAPKALVQALLDRQSRSGGWGWARGVAPDSNDTAAAVEALRAAGVSGVPIRRGLDYLRGLRNGDGGFALVRNRQSDAQSTAWAVQAFLSAGVRAPTGAYAYLSRLRRADGSYRYSKRYAVTPVWVTAQVLPAVAHKAFPLEQSPSIR
jgi:Prenyltransferase and squalene oxidase repeat